MFVQAFTELHPLPASVLFTDIPNVFLYHVFNVAMLITGEVVSRDTVQEAELLFPALSVTDNVIVFAPSTIELADVNENVEGTVEPDETAVVPTFNV